MSRASTTFSYHRHQHPMHVGEEDCSAGGDKHFPKRYHQTFDRALLHRQLEHTNLIFEAYAGTGTGHIVERMSEAHITSLPTDTQIRTRCRMLNLQHADITLMLEAAPRRLLNTYSSGSLVRAEFPSPWWTIVSYQGLDKLHTTQFINEHIEDKPLLQLAESVRHSQNLLEAYGRLYLHQEDHLGSASLVGATNLIDQTVSGGWRPVSPIICGFVMDLTDNGLHHNSCVIWSPIQPIGNAALGEVRFQPVHPQLLGKWQERLH